MEEKHQLLTWVFVYQTEAVRWVTSASLGGRPSGIDSKRKSGKPSRELGPLDLSKRLWLCSVLTKVMKKPLLLSSFAICSSGFTWPWDGYGIHRAWGLPEALIEPISLSLSLSHTHTHTHAWVYTPWDAF